MATGNNYLWLNQNERRAFGAAVAVADRLVSCGSEQSVGESCLSLSLHVCVSIVISLARLLAGCLWVAPSTGPRLTDVSIYQE